MAFEVLSPGNDYKEMADKLQFYDTYGVEEYYVYDPDRNTLEVYLRQGTVLRRFWPKEDFVSPRLRIRFQLGEPEMYVFYPDNSRFLTHEEFDTERMELK